MRFGWRRRKVDRNRQKKIQKPKATQQEQHKGDFNAEKEKQIDKQQPTERETETNVQKETEREAETRIFLIYRIQETV